MVCSKSKCYYIQFIPNETIFQNSTAARIHLMHVWSFENERPILDHHAKAHNFEIRRISWNPADFTPDFVKSSGFHVKSSGFHEILGHSPHPAFIKLKSFCCYKVLGGFHMKSGWNLPDFTGEIGRISKDQLPGMVSPMLIISSYREVLVKTVMLCDWVVSSVNVIWCKVQSGLKLLLTEQLLQLTDIQLNFS